VSSPDLKDYLSIAPSKRLAVLPLYRSQLNRQHYLIGVGHFSSQMIAFMVMVRPLVSLPLYIANHLLAS